MSLNCIANSLINSTRQLSGIGNSEVHFLKKKPAGYSVEGILSDDWIPVTKFSKELGADVLYLQISATQENYELLQKCGHVVFRYLNLLMDGRIYTLGKETSLPLNQSFWLLAMKPTTENHTF